LPDEVRRRVVEAVRAPTVPLEAAGGRVLHVRFKKAAGADRVVAAMETIRGLLRERPGETRIVLHLPAGEGDGLPVELKRGVAYDAEFLAEIRRRVGDGLVELSFA
jgi:hypothetical protein